MDANKIEAVPEKGSDLKSSMLGGLIAGLITAVIGLAGQFFIGYWLIEKPKQAAEAQAKLNQLMPILASECNANSIDPWMWRVICVTKNAGVYPAQVSISKVVLLTTNNPPDRPMYQDGQGFHISYEDGRSTYQSIPTSTSQLTFYVQFDKKQYPDGLHRIDLDAMIVFSYQTPIDISNGVKAAFSLSDDEIQSRSGNGQLIEALLPVWRQQGDVVPAVASPLSSPSPASASSPDVNSPMS